MLDIDYFKRINDNFGHQTGDAVLSDISLKTQSLLRQYDLLGRYGGEEFLILLPDTDHEAALSVAQKLCDTLPTIVRLPDQGSVTSSFGITTVLKNDTVDSLLHRCDLALYEAKYAGRNQVKYRKN
jgi:diguanylate cyclase (GGDEF)-like protein